MSHPLKRIAKKGSGILRNDSLVPPLPTNDDCKKSEQLNESKENASAESMDGDDGDDSTKPLVGTQKDENSSVDDSILQQQQHNESVLMRGKKSAEPPREEDCATLVYNGNTQPNKQRRVDWRVEQKWAMSPTTQTMTKSFLRKGKSHVKNLTTSALPNNSGYLSTEPSTESA